jgi:hypothetical protein
VAHVVHCLKELDYELPELLVGRRGWRSFERSRRDFIAPEEVLLSASPAASPEGPLSPERFRIAHDQLVGWAQDNAPLTPDGPTAGLVGRAIGSPNERPH